MAGRKVPKKEKWARLYKAVEALLDAPTGKGIYIVVPAPEIDELIEAFDGCKGLILE